MPFVHAVAPSLQSDDLGVVEEAVEDSAGDSRIPEAWPLGGGGRQAAHARVFDNQEVHLPEAADELPAGAGSLGLSHLA